MAERIKGCADADRGQKDKGEGALLMRQRLHIHQRLWHIISPDLLDSFDMIGEEGERQPCLLLLRVPLLRYDDNYDWTGSRASRIMI